MWPVTVFEDRLQLGEYFGLSFQRTLRLPEDGGTYPLPPTLGAFPLRSTRQPGVRLPAAWRRTPGVFFPIYQREAVWLAFEAPDWHPLAVKVGVGRVNALTGGPWDERLHADPQDYLVCPPQLWLDGVILAEGVVRQFVAVPLGLGATLEAQVHGRERFGGIQVLVFDARPGRFPEQPPPAPAPPAGAPFGLPTAPQGFTAPREMGLGMGGRMRQKVYADPYGLETWQTRPSGRVQVYLLDSLSYQQVTGEPPPPSPVSAADYTRLGLPWFELYDADLPALEASAALQELHTVGELLAEPGPQEAEAPVEMTPDQIVSIKKHPQAPP